jgi:ATP-dependent DNA ligase
MKNLKDIVSNLKPDMSKARSIDDVPLPCTLMAKADGEFNIVFYADGNLFTCNKWGRTRRPEDYNALRELETALKKWDAETAVIEAELFSCDVDQWAGFNNAKPRRLYDFLSNKTNRNLSLGLFELTELDGEIPAETYHERLRLMDSILSYTMKIPRYVWTLPYFQATEKIHVKNMWDWLVLGNGWEGLVATSQEDKMKVKPRHRVEGAVIGVAKEGLLKHGRVTSILVAVYMGAGEWVKLTDVASGITRDSGSALKALTEAQVDEDRDYIYVPPQMMVHVEYQETIPSVKRVWKYEKGAYRELEKTHFYSLRSPVVSGFQMLHELGDVGADQLK